MFRCLLVITVGSWSLFGQRATAINNSRSNIKNNVVVAEPNGNFKCALPDGKPCTADDLHGVKVPGLRAVTTKGLAGYITCETTEGKTCSDTQVKTLSAKILAGWDLKKGTAARTAPAK